VKILRLFDRIRIWKLDVYSCLLAVSRRQVYLRFLRVAFLFLRFLRVFLRFLRVFLRFLRVFLRFLRYIVLFLDATTGLTMRAIPFSVRSHWQPVPATFLIGTTDPILQLGIFYLVALKKSKILKILDFSVYPLKY